MHPIDQLLRAAFSVGKPDRWCRRALCKRHRMCVSPPCKDHEGLYRCPVDDEEKWLDRAEIADKLLARILKRGEASFAAAGRPWPLVPKPADEHLDLEKPLDLVALFAEAHEELRPFAGLDGYRSESERSR